MRLQLNPVSKRGDQPKGRTAWRFQHPDRKQGGFPPNNRLAKSFRIAAYNGGLGRALNQSDLQFSKRGRDFVEITLPAGFCARARERFRKAVAREMNLL